jgi:hypothetical protein
MRVAVAVDGDADVRLEVLDRVQQRLQVLRYRFGVHPAEVGVALLAQGVDFQSQSGNQRLEVARARAVHCVRHDAIGRLVQFIHANILVHMLQIVGRGV